uniref:Protocadherin Fat 4 (Trinotate prediction) n=1 Tax=Henneguya salminicola TaxID=69463 RepID=A0A6G3MET6_HENSL
METTRYRIEISTSHFDLSIQMFYHNSFCSEFQNSLQPSNIDIPFKESNTLKCKNHKNNTSLYDLKNKDYCEPNPCHNNGVCNLLKLNKTVYIIGSIQTPNRIYCTCKKRYYGNLCQYKNACVNCKINSCTTHNHCSKCKTGWSGEDCKTITCTNVNICQNDGVCSEHDNKRQCYCSELYFGEYCEFYCPYYCKNQECSFIKVFGCVYVIGSNKVPQSFLLRYIII